MINLLEDEEKTRCHDYRDDYRALRPGMVFIDFPVPDYSTVDDEASSLLLCSLLRLLHADPTHCLYVHCWGGHGRSGVVAASLLGVWHRIPGASALRKLQRVHLLRGHRGDWESPQTDAQRAQVHRLIEMHTGIHSPFIPRSHDQAEPKREEEQSKE